MTRIRDALDVLLGRKVAVERPLFSGTVECSSGVIFGGGTIALGGLDITFSGPSNGFTLP